MRISDWSSDVCSSDLAAEQPRLELMAGRAIGAFVIEQRQPCLLLAFRGKGQMPHRVHVDLPTAIEGADARQQIAERKDALHRRQIGRASCRERVCQYV